MSEYQRIMRRMFGKDRTWQSLTPDELARYRAAIDERTQKQRGRNFTLPRRSDGKGIVCRVPICNNRPKPPRTSFCSEECSDLFIVFFRSFRDAVGYLGHYRCVLCSKVCAEIQMRRHGTKVVPTLHELARWEADHILPLAEGGKTTLENGRVLCEPCHRSETRGLRGRLAWVRQKQKDLITDGR